ncbi:predicted protein [Naegleria gruberi]|uniref:Transketolase n=1 Tax=Naegleria gruberi TaxID=5762 RepID=D2VZK8_NAEGR|nr:uncharacterized protein NAEGRDRAFT_60965 [Naegleria gruberi]EFC37674.1 predicted protein [Naegleria gruberi]|eukprot:XP_002670418.1 predicted protein [Naegleria gruberi strain NEG-M]
MSNILKPHLQHIAVGTLRCLTADMVEKAKSGHPGMPIGMSTIAFVLWKYFYRASGKDPTWINRDRFILSNGHGCALQYALLHLTGYESMPMEQLQKLRTLDSNTPGHPEWFHTDGVDATTGPLGQGMCNSIGMAVAECHLSKRFNRNELKLFDHYTYVFCGDGDLMEGMSTEGMSFAGHQQLNKVIVFYDDNRITIDGSTDLTFTQDTAMVARGLGWHVIEVHDADSNLLRIKEAIETARLVTNKPSMIICKTTIGYGTKQEGTAKAHGTALGEDSVRMLKKFCGFNPDDHFIIPSIVREEFEKISDRNAKYLQEWNDMTQKYANSHKSEWEMLMRMRRGEIEDSLEKFLPKFEDEKSMATRMCSHEVLNGIFKIIPAMVGGSADLTPSNLTDIEGQKDFQPHSREGRYFRFGVREHGMCSISNGILYHGLLRTYVGTFLNFASYGLGAIRLSALAQLPNIFVLTHDSIGLGEDGPTHQPIEVLTALRAIPNMNVIRPADGRETSGAYLSAIKTLKTPTCLALSRQNVPPIKNSSIEKTLKGAYILEQDENPDVILVATGSEVQLIVEAKKQLNERQINVRTISMPSWELFDAQPLEYRQEIFTAGIPCLSVEAASIIGWSKYSHHQIGMLNFGASGKYTDVYEKNQITTRNVVESSIKLIDRYKKSAPSLILAPLKEEKAL